MPKTHLKVTKTSSDTVYHYCEGVVYSPNEIDTDLETISEEDVLKMAHDFIAAGKVMQIDTQHNHELNGCEVVESFVARKGDPDYPEGAWVLKIRMTEDSPIWEAVQNGDLNGYSVESFVTKAPMKVMVENTKVAVDHTEENKTDELPDHKHEYYIEFDENGHVAFGITDSVEGHAHKILTTTATEKTLDHSHRYFV